MSEAHIPDPLPITGFKLPLRASFTGIKSAPLLAMADNSIAPLLKLYDDHIEYRVILKGKKDYAQIERIEAVQGFGTQNVILIWRDSNFTFTGNLRQEEWLRELLRFFQRRQLPLSASALQVLDAPKKE